MRVLGSIPHPRFKITAFTLERFYYVEIEAGPMKQGYKLHKEHFASLAEIAAFMDDNFLGETNRLFEEMYSNYKQAMDRHKE